MSVKRLVALTAAVALTASLVFGFWRLRQAILIIVCAGALMAAVERPVRALCRFDLGRRAAIGMVYLGLLLLGLFTASIVVGSFLDELARGTDRLVSEYNRLLLFVAHQGGHWSALTTTLPRPEALLSFLRTAHPALVARSALVASSMVLQGLASLLVLFVLAIYFSLFRGQVVSILLMGVSAPARARLRRGLDHMERSVGDRVFAEGTKTLLTVAVLDLAFRALGQNFATFPAVMSGFLRIIPFAGWGMAALISGLCGSDPGWSTGLLAAGLTGGWLLFQDHLLIPSLLPVRSFHPLIIVASLLALIPTYGWLGLVVAPVTAAAGQSLYEWLVLNQGYRRDEVRDVQGLLAEAARLEEEAYSHASVHETRDLAQRLHGLRSEMDRGMR